MTRRKFTTIEAMQDAVKRLYPMQNASATAFAAHLAQYWDVEEDSPAHEAVRQLAASLWYEAQESYINDAPVGKGFYIAGTMPEPEDPDSEIWEQRAIEQFILNVCNTQI